MTNNSNEYRDSSGFIQWLEWLQLPQLLYSGYSEYSNYSDGQYIIQGLHVLQSIQYATYIMTLGDHLYKGIVLIFNMDTISQIDVFGMFSILQWISCELSNSLGYSCNV